MKKYKIMSRNGCEKYCHKHHDESSIIISIKSTWDRVEPDVFSNADNGVKHILSLSFDDVELEDSASACMQFSDGAKIAEFINNYFSEADVIIVHCDGGVSRNAGVMAAILRVTIGRDSPVFDNKTKHPNMTCYLRTLRGFGYI